MFQFTAVQYSSLYTLMAGLGILAVYCLGALTYWRYVAAIPVVFCILNFLLLLPLPESPLWLLGHHSWSPCQSCFAVAQTD